MIFSEKVQAKLEFEDHSFPEFATSARALAMGNAYINKVDDSWSAFYNPAGLGSVRRPEFHLLNVHLEANNGLLDMANDGSALKFPEKVVSIFNDKEQLKENLAKHKDELIHSRVNLFPNLTIRGLTLGYLYSRRNRSILNEEESSDFEILDRRDHGPVASLNLSFFGGVFKIGATGIYLQRKELYKSFTPVQEVNVDDSEYKSGVSLQLITGARLTFPVPLLPTFSAVLRNATANDFNKAKPDQEAPEQIRQTYDLGFSITPQLGGRARLHLEANLKDVNNSYDTNAKRRVAAGFELDYARKFFFRGGWGDGWGSGGLGIKSKGFTMDISTYAVDKTLNGFREEEDRRWVLSMSLGY